MLIRIVGRATFLLALLQLMWRRPSAQWQPIPVAYVLYTKRLIGLERPIHTACVCLCKRTGAKRDRVGPRERDAGGAKRAKGPIEGIKGSGGRVQGTVMDGRQLDVEGVQCQRSSTSSWWWSSRFVLCQCVFGRPFLRDLPRNNNLDHQKLISLSLEESSGLCENHWYLHIPAQHSVCKAKHFLATSRAGLLEILSQSLNSLRYVV